MFSTYHELLSCSENGGDWVLNNKSLWQIWEEKVAPMFPSRTFNKVVNVFYWSKRKWIWKFPMSSPCRLRYDLLAPKFFIASNSHWSDWKKSRPKLLRLGGLLRVKSGVFFFQGNWLSFPPCGDFQLGKWKLRSILLHFHPSQLSEFSMKLLEAWCKEPFGSSSSRKAFSLKHLILFTLWMFFSV